MLSEAPEILVVEPSLPEMLVKSESCEVLMEETLDSDPTLAMTCEVSSDIDTVLPISEDANEISCQTTLTGDDIEKIKHENFIMKQEWETLKSGSNVLVVKMW
jgi:hypothetical protein